MEQLLKHGAYDVFKEGEEGQKAGKQFCEDSIDAILSRAMVRGTVLVESKQAFLCRGAKYPVDKASTRERTCL